MLYDLWRIFWDSVSKFVRWIKPEPLTVTVRQWVAFGVLFGAPAVLIAVASFYGGRASFENSAKEKLMVQEGVTAEAQAKREDEEKKLVQQREEQEMKTAQESEEQQKQFAQKQKEPFDKAFHSSTPEDPTKVAKERAAANVIGHYYDAERYSQQYDTPPGSDATVWGHQTYTDPNGVIWEQKPYTDSKGVIRDRFEPQLPKEVAR
jgi:hypothetical protein